MSARTGSKKLFARVRTMVRQAKTYGKKKGHELADAFKKLQVSSPAAKEAKRTVLAPVSANVLGKRPENTTGTREDVTSQAANLADKQPENSGKGQPIRPQFDPEDEITALTSLESVASEIQDFRKYIEHNKHYLDITKVAQGGFGAVLKMSAREDPSQYTIWKLLPLRPKKGQGSRRADQTFINDAAAEMRVLTLMSECYGFVDYRSARVLRGSLPILLQKLEKDWAKKHPEEDDGLTYPPGQLWLLVEMSDAGTDLDALLRRGYPDGTFFNGSKKGTRLNIQQTWDIFWGVAEALSFGEKFAQFEHRDLHPGNICIINGHEDGLGYESKITRFTNLRITIIDYSLSRATMEGGEIFSNAMKDEALFNATSENPMDNRQYETYRRMRKCVLAANRIRRKSKADWTEFVPLTNILWLGNLLKVLMDETEQLSVHQRKDLELQMVMDGILRRIDPDGDISTHWLSATALVDDRLARYTT